MVHSFPNSLKLKQRQKPVNNVLLSLDNVSFGYSPFRPLLHNVNWQLREGESWAVLGASGSGKTTLLYLLAGLRKPKQGRVLFDGKAAAGTNQAVGLMLQDYGLLPWYTARQNVELGMQIRGKSRLERQRIADKWLERLEIGHVADQYPTQLSGGQRQRVALARLLALETRVLLLDEPFAAVDEITRERLQKLLWNLEYELGTTTVLVTHNVEEAALLADNIMVITDYAPIEGFVVLENPFKDGMPERSDPYFIDFCSEIRDYLGL